MTPDPLMLGVSGLRGTVGGSLTPPTVRRYTSAFGHWLTAAIGGRRAPRVVVGRDSRPSGSLFDDAATEGLVAAGCHVIRLGIATTPAVAIMVAKHRADGGVVITASHNPIEWNGVKVLRADGVAPAPDQISRIIDLFQSDAAPDMPIGQQSQSQQSPTQQDETADQVHVERILDRFDAAAVASGNLKVVLDSVHGAGGTSTAMLVRGLGAELIHLYAEPSGQFPHPPEPLREHLCELCAQVRAHGADIGFAQDPDADRLAIVDETGRFLGEEYTLALACLHVMERHRDPGPPVIVANLSTSRMVDDIAAQFGGRVVRTPVGEANVADAMRVQGAAIGGEGNGGVIWPPIGHVRDSLTGIALIMRLLADRAEPVSAIVRRLRAYAIVKEKVAISDEVVHGLEATLRQRFGEQAIDVQDGVRIDWPYKWIHVRRSNTEPIMRLIAEAADENEARELISETRRVLGIEPQAS